MDAPFNAHTAGQEKDYIREESIRLFRQNKELLDPEVIRAKVDRKGLGPGFRSHSALTFAAAGSTHSAAQLLFAIKGRNGA